MRIEHVKEFFHIDNRRSPRRVPLSENRLFQFIFNYFRSLAVYVYDDSDILNIEELQIPANSYLKIKRFIVQVDNETYEIRQAADIMGVLAFLAEVTDFDELSYYGQYSYNRNGFVGLAFLIDPETISYEPLFRVFRDISEKSVFDDRCEYKCVVQQEDLSYLISRKGFETAPEYHEDCLRPGLGGVDGIHDWICDWTNVFINLPCDSPKECIDALTDAVSDIPALGECRYTKQGVIDDVDEYEGELTIWVNECITLHNNELPVYIDHIRKIKALCDQYSIPFEHESWFAS